MNEIGELLTSLAGSGWPTRAALDPLACATIERADA